MFRLTAPSEDEVRSFIDRQSSSRFSYHDVGTSAADTPPGYNVDHNRIQLGAGEATWLRAVAAIRGWQMFNVPWVHLYSPNAPIQVGTNVAVLVDHFGFHSLNACRIAYVVDEDGPIRRFGFAYGTLWEHAESGEERFIVEWRRHEDEVWYDILAFSRPRTVAARLAYPLSRHLQRKFAEASKLAMQRAANNS